MLGFLIFDILDTCADGSAFLVTSGCYLTYNKVRVDALDGYAIFLNFFGEGGRERVNERFGTGIRGEHRGRDDPAE